MFVYFVSFQYSNAAMKEVSRMEVSVENKISSINDIFAIEQHISSHQFSGTMEVKILHFEQMRKE